MDNPLPSKTSSSNSSAVKETKEEDEDDEENEVDRRTTSRWRYRTPCLGPQGSLKSYRISRPLLSLKITGVCSKHRLSVPLLNLRLNGSPNQTSPLDQERWDTSPKPSKKAVHSLLSPTMPNQNRRS